MRLTTSFAAIALAVGIVDAGRSGKYHHERTERLSRQQTEPLPMQKRASSVEPKYLTNKTASQYPEILTSRVSLISFRICR